MGKGRTGFAGDIQGMYQPLGFMAEIKSFNRKLLRKNQYSIQEGFQRYMAARPYGMSIKSRLESWVIKHWDTEFKSVVIKQANDYWMANK